ncbi:hypothetical protein R1X32_05265 (plasmid) [Rhodococcus opacus]|uniref:hypothetical protein n=1 Tax=Rhodococcus opacus TaxID=37919 RepID=UPI0034D15261
MCTAGTAEVDPATVPKSRDWVLRTVGALLSENTDTGKKRLAAAGREADPVRRVTRLADSLIWLDFLVQDAAAHP